jgi:hypothetical protein
LTRFCQFDASADPVEQGDSNVLFQRLYLGGYARLRIAQSGGGTRHAFSGRDGLESPQLT